MTNEEIVLEQIKMQKRNAEDCVIDWNVLDFLENSIQENTKLKAEIERLKENYEALSKQYCNVENSSIRYYNEMKKLKAELEQLNKYNSELCMELTITMDKLCLAEKEVERLRNGK